MSLVVRGGFIVISYTDNKAAFPDSRRQSTSVRFNDTGLSVLSHGVGTPLS